MKSQKINTKKLPGKKTERQVSKVWINPDSSFRSTRGNRAWDHQQLSAPTAARFLELADTALGSVEPWTAQIKKKKSAA